MNFLRTAIVAFDGHSKYRLQACEYVTRGYNVIGLPLYCTINSYIYYIASLGLLHMLFNMCCATLRYRLITGRGNVTGRG